MLFGLTIAIASFLLFQMQLILGKRLLPWHGGVPAVWTTCMLCFQALLLAGYGCAHLAGRWKIRNEMTAHFVLSAGALGLLGWLWFRSGLALVPGSEWKPAGSGSPVTHVLATLLVHAGFPFLVLAAASPMLQRWQAAETKSERAYRLYAISNAGSLAGLLSYPVLFEPMLGVAQQSVLWLAGFAAFVFCLGLIAAKRPGEAAEPVRSAEPASAQPRPSMATALCWIFLPAAGSACMLSVTNEICQEVAVVPFLWVLPLAVYLVSFILCFDRPQSQRRSFWLFGGYAGSLLALLAGFLGLRLPIPHHVLAFTVFLFFFCMVCHGELVRLRPPAAQASLFYLCMAAGGALGGVLVGMAAPMFFSGYWEFHIVLLGGWILFAVVLGRDRGSVFYSGHPQAFALVALGLAIPLSQLLVRALEQWGGPETARALRGWPQLALALLLAAGAAAAAKGKPWAQSKYWPRILAGLIVFWAECFLVYRVRSNQLETLAMERNFYGVARIQEEKNEDSPPLRKLIHGRVLHGLQIVHPRLELAANAYYSVNSGLGMAFRGHPRRSQTNSLPLRVGIAGLGAGAITGYGREGDFFRYYEINPAIVKFADGPEAPFTYLSKSPAETSVVVGDARLSLERELKSGGGQSYDLLILDAFSSDSIPTHLLTLEAFELYARHLRDTNSVIAVNISNRFLDPAPVLAAAAGHLKMHAWQVESTGIFPFAVPAKWVLLARRHDLLSAFAGEPQAAVASLTDEPRRAIRWTDDHSNLLRVLNVMPPSPK